MLPRDHRSRLRPVCYYFLFQIKRPFSLAEQLVEIISHGHKMIIRGHEIISGGLKIKSRGQEKISGGLKIISRGYEIISRCHKIITVGHEIIY
jgi:hypothetical protein